jgi:hypothetical protein
MSLPGNFGSIGGYACDGHCHVGYYYDDFDC